MYIGRWNVTVSVPQCTQVNVIATVVGSNHSTVLLVLRVTWTSHHQKVGKLFVFAVKSIVSSSSNNNNTAVENEVTHIFCSRNSRTVDESADQHTYTYEGACVYWVSYKWLRVKMHLKQLAERERSEKAKNESTQREQVLPLDLLEGYFDHVNLF